MDLRGVILAGGSGSRLRPLTKVTNKHLLPVGQKPMIYYPIEKLTSIGIEQILIVTGVEYMGDVVGLLGSGGSLAVSLRTECRMRPAELPRLWDLRRILHRNNSRLSSSGTISFRQI